MTTPESTPDTTGGSAVPPPGERCKFLRTKTMYYEFNREAALSIGPPCDTASFRCVKTARVVGPDGEPVNPGDCTPSRACFEA